MIYVAHTSNAITPVYTHIVICIPFFRRRKFRTDPENATPKHPATPGARGREKAKHLRTIQKLKAREDRD